VTHARARGALAAGVCLAAAALGAPGCGEDRNYHPVVTEGAASGADARQAAAPAQVSGPASQGPRQSSPAGRDASAAATASPASAQASAPSSGAETSEGTVDAAPPAADYFEPDGVTPTDAGRDAVRSVVDELSLPSPPAVAETPGDEPFQKLARDRRFDEFRRKSARYVQLRKQLIPLGRKLGDGSATPAERALHNRIEAAISVEFKPLNRYMWDERWTEADRAAMGWILFVPPE